MTDAGIRPFRLAIGDDAITDLKDRIRRTRFPDEAPDASWAYGSSLAFMRELADHWVERYDWRATEAALNAYPQYRTTIDGIDLHFLHVPGKGPKPRPLLLSHGWPGSVLEFMKLIPLLTDPAAHGGHPEDAFTVVAPSLPGYGLSFTPGQKRCALPDIGAIFDTLMDRLGYARYGAQGGDWGSSISAWLGAFRPERVAAIHLNFLSLRREPEAYPDPSPAERRYFEELAVFVKEEAGYQAIQGTRPQTLAFGLSDSPIGLAAWLVEKFRAWTDCDGDPRNALSMDEMLGDISLYWFTGCIGASFWPYYARMHGPWPIDRHVTVPTGYAQFPREIFRPPREAAERFFNIQRWTVMERGGHFAALERPRELATEIREFFRDRL